ncbi:Citrate synthase, mitochondrial [Wickerhamomyces ciferrii]|uniref:Citrate synthase n=1 Tax=Wickerhamomyces ciferrii (strain ATCC 14091 / BCRC 22168 / CBS 111 / JCM 3599 / NBRC 0793 / NRRL Y-1031 F-60-10) TaxID=1206466 RepID=K0KVK2_WICCF|nr:Citrate synthase, mitochondrial [Wickerhamomyces ciferrii]CCH45499.1 Citrate synthase, mitochondrial [Wickerhamomyces ciferrii]
MLRSIRSYSTHVDLKTTLQNAIPAKRELYQYVKKNLANKEIGQLTAGGTIGGMRGYKSLLWEASVVDPNEGIRFHGYTIQECQKFLPKAKDEINDPKSEFLPESMFWFLLTGNKPSQDQINEFSNELALKAGLPDYLNKILDSLPSSLHPMTQLSIAISALNNDSKFAKAYASGIPKNDYWEYTFEDSINLIAKLPAIVGKIYSNTYHNGEKLGELNLNKDWSYNLSSLLGLTSNDSLNLNKLNQDQSKDVVNLVRLYCALHGDHEGGNVSAHTTHLVGSALSDPFLSYSAGVQGLAGPLHGLAAQEVVRFIVEMNSNLQNDISNSTKIEEYLWGLLNSKRVIPGYGHGVLRKPDPRFEAMLQFGLKRSNEFANDELFHLVKNLSEIAPGVLKKHGKTKNPYPNVDSSSGVLFYHYGIKELLFFTVIFGASRSIGPLSQLIWDRVLGLPIERPKSVDLKTLAQ